MVYVKILARHSPGWIKNKNFRHNNRKVGIDKKRVFPEHKSEVLMSNQFAWYQSFRGSPDINQELYFRQ